MIQPRTQTREYWEQEFTLTDADVDQIYNYFLEVEKPQGTAEIVRAVMQYRISAEKNDLLRQVADRKIYQPAESYAVGDDLVFPLQEFAHGKVTAIRDGNSPDIEAFKVITVKMGTRERQYSAELPLEHPANLGEGGFDSLLQTVSNDQLYADYAHFVEPKVLAALEGRDGFVVLGGKWFVEALLADVNIGHLHLAEAVLDMSGGGPLTTSEIRVHLDMDGSLETETQQFSLNHALLNDSRFDEVAPKDSVMWFLNRMAPSEVRATPARLEYSPQSYDADLVSGQLRVIEREIADEWSDLEVNDAVADSITFAINYPHRVTGTPAAQHDPAQAIAARPFAASASHIS